MKLMKDLARKDVKNLAEQLAKRYSKTDVIIGLMGQLGAGKTAFAKDFAQFFGVKKIKSPTFIIGSVYQIKKRQLHHYDFYRLSDPKQLETLGIDEILSSKNRIVLIEWVDKFPKIAKQCDIILIFEVSGKNIRNVYVKNSRSK